MTATLRRFSVILALTLNAGGACDKARAEKTDDATARSSSDALRSSASSADACTSDNCVVPLADISGVCGPTLQAATTDCPGLTVSTASCDTLTHVTLQTAGPTQDCYYDTTSGALVGGIIRSDAGFTKLAGTIPTDACPATTQVCDHSPAT